MQHFLILATLASLGLTCFLSFSWGIKGHFRSTGKIPPGMKLISLLSLAGFLGFAARLIAGSTAGYSQTAIALGLFAMALALFFWTIRATRQTPPTLAFDTDKPVFLLLHGPYRYVRHPFYLSYMLFWVGTAAAGGGLLAWLTPLVMLAVYQNAASTEERKFAGSDFGSAYARYRKRAGMFFPKPGILAG